MKDTWLCELSASLLVSEFRSGKAPILIATDVASRGLGMCSEYREIFCTIPINTHIYNEITFHPNSN